jgi:hypothetical protein
MANAVKKTISVPSDLAAEPEAQAKAEGKTLSAVIEDATKASAHRASHAGDSRRSGLLESKGTRAWPH